MQNVASVVVDLIQCTNEPNVSIPQLANLMIERTQHLSWVVVFKSLISLHHLMNYGNEVGSSGRLLLLLSLSVLPLEAFFVGRGALPLFGDALPFLKS